MDSTSMGVCWCVHVLPVGTNMTDHGLHVNLQPDTQAVISPVCTAVFRYTQVGGGSSTSAMCPCVCG